MGGADPRWWSMTGEGRHTLPLDDGLALPAFRPASGPLVEVDQKGGGVVAQLAVVVENGVG